MGMPESFYIDQRLRELIADSMAQQVKSNVRRYNLTADVVFSHDSGPACSIYTAEQIDRFNSAREKRQLTVDKAKRGSTSR